MWDRMLPRVLMGLCAVLVAGMGAAGGYLYAIGGVPDSDSTEAGFARAMQVPHAQAVYMSMVILKETDDPRMRSVAYDIVATQQQQASQLYRWLELWNLPHGSTQPPMTWMNEPSVPEMPGAGNMAAMTMSGMATAEELDRFRTLRGRSAEVLYLRLMIRNCQGSVVMAEAVRRLGREPKMLGIAQEVIDSRTAEIVKLRQLLTQRRRS